MITCVNILCYEPNKIMIDFIKDMYNYFKEKKLNYSIYLTIDSDKKEYKSEEEYTVIQFNHKKATKAGYKDIYLRYYHKKDAKVKSMALDKSLYYFTRNNKFDYYWFIEDDVFIPSVKTIPYLDRKYKESDLLISSCNEKKDDKMDWHWPLMVRNNRNKLRKKRLEKAEKSKDYYFEKPWYHGWCQVFRISSKFIEKIEEFVKKNKTLTFMEFFFATLAKKNEMKISEVQEFKLKLCYECKEKNLFKLNEINWKNLYHYFKDPVTQKEFRERKNYKY